MIVTRREVFALVVLLVTLSLALAGEASAQAFGAEAEAEAYWAATGYPVCYPGGNGYYWDGYSWVWYPCQVY
jgi:hypothetical protein